QQEWSLLQAMNLERSFSKVFKCGSPAVAPVFQLIICFIIILLALAFLYLKFAERIKRNFTKSNFFVFLILLILTAALIIPIRGGLQLAPINQSAVYFSNDQYLNQAAVNPSWNFIFSIIEKNYNETNPFNYLPEPEAKERVNKLHTPTDSTIRIIKEGKINIVFVIWESFTAKTVEPLGGRKGITPKFNQLIQEGIFFNNIYASGDRSDKGLIAILSSFPAQPITSIMRKPTKTDKLPSLSESLKKNLYNTAFYYGGESEFANIKTYLINCKYD
ncbi:MAG: sulfatase-like hydrolase/transferase, partial [Cytophagaceae bacterium]|nr:sulfatase-like hydrolase/transferase [Cytophagaceae bacterium]